MVNSRGCNLMSSDYVNKKKDNFVKIIDSSNDFEMLASSIFVYYNINGKRSHLPLNELIKQFANLKRGKNA
jgi:hypothetical protein